MIRLMISLAVLITLYIAGCSQGYLVNMNAPTSHAEGRELFVSKCNACHQLYSPARLTAAEWDSVLVPMQNKAKLNSEQREAIYSWIMEVKRAIEDSVRAVREGGSSR